MTPKDSIFATYMAVAAVGLPAYVSPPPFLIWNASASVPVGLYMLVLWDSPLQVGDLVIARPPEPLATYLDKRNSLPRGVVLVKPIAALAGQRVCREGADVSIDGRQVAQAKAQDKRGRALPVWSGCRTLGTDEIFLLNSARPDSLDGRYFGPLPAKVVIGRVAVLWTPKGAGPWP